MKLTPKEFVALLNTNEIPVMSQVLGYVVSISYIASINPIDNTFDGKNDEFVIEFEHSKKEEVKK